MRLCTHQRCMLGCGHVLILFADCLEYATFEGPVFHCAEVHARIAAADGAAEKLKCERLCCNHALLMAPGHFYYSHDSLLADRQGKAEAPLNMHLQNHVHLC